MIKVMHVDTVFEVFIFKFFYFGYFFYARRGTYLMMESMVNFLKTLKPPISGESSIVQKCPIWGHHTQIHDLTALNAGIRREKNIYFCTHLYHRDHTDRLFPAIYVGAKINEY